jgi:hypothetical protein
LGGKGATEIVDRFWTGCMQQDDLRRPRAVPRPEIYERQGGMSPLDMLAEPKVIEGKASKIDLNDPNECFRIYARLVRRIGS